MPMANTLNNGDFWLPSEFLTHDCDILMDRENFNKNSFNSAYGIPSEFPYDFGLSSPVESMVGSTETESDEEEDVLAGFTRRFALSTLQEKSPKIESLQPNLEKPWILSGSPQSTLTAFGSWSGRSGASSNGSPNGSSLAPSPPTTPPGGIDSWDLLYAAAGHVASLKMNGNGPPFKLQGLPGGFQLRPPPAKNPSTGIFLNQCLSHNFSPPNHFEQGRKDQGLKQQCPAVRGRQVMEDFFTQQMLMPQNRGNRFVDGGGLEISGRYSCPPSLSLTQSTRRPPLQFQHQNHPPQHGGGGSNKRECAGTGVFIPRRYCNNPSDSRKKPGCSTTPLPARVVHALNRNLDDMTNQLLLLQQSKPQFNGAFNPEYDSFMMRRKNALVARHNYNPSARPEGAKNHELCLPQEWTY